MPFNIPEMAQIAAIFAGILSLFVLVGGLKARNWLRLKENKLRWEVGEQIKKFRSEAQQAVGGAIGRFMQNLTNQAAEEEGAAGPSSPGGAFNLGGFKIDAGTIRSIAELLKMAKDMGFLKSGGEGGGKMGL